MKSSYKILIPLLALGMAGGVSLARAAADDVQTPLPAAPDNSPPAKGEKGEKGDRGMRGREAKALKEKLNLTDDQVKKIEEIRKSHAEDFKAARGDHAKMGELMKTMHEETRAVLTPDQQKEFDAMPPPGGPRGGKKKDGPPPPPPAAPPAPPAPTT